MLGQSGPGSNGNEGVLHIHQSPRITGTSPSDCLESYTRHSLGRGGLTPLQRCSWCILQSQPTGHYSRLVSIHVVHTYSSNDMIVALKKLRFILSVRSDFCMTDSLLIAVHAFVSHMSMSVSVDETLFPCQLVSESYCLVWKCRLFD